MAQFKTLIEGKIGEREDVISKQWEAMNLLQKTIDNREGQENFVFYEGPPTANGRPGIHHVLARTLKDTVCKYKVMDGYRVIRKGGWDTHGLPVEIEVEKQLGLSSKLEIEAYGIDKFNEKCKESVFNYESQWKEMSRKMGYFIDMEDPYITLDNNYIETVWWILDKFNKEGFLYEGHKIMPYCPRCGTGLASHEVAQGYQEIKSNTVVAAFKRSDANEYFLVWTTTPWTLAANVALAVHPDADYIKARSNDEVYICAKVLAPKLLGEDYEILEEMKGSALEYVEYEQLMPFVVPDKKAFFVTCADYVTTEDGTGIVHIAPAFGEDDYKVGRQYNLPVLQPVAEDGKYTDTPWKGQFVIDADLDIIKWLKAEGKLFKKEKVTHNYPHCWRCKTPLLYYAKPSWYLEMTKIKDRLIENNNGVEWYPDFVGEKRFGNWLENLNDWAISRSRYWGTPLPVWRCEECGKLETVGSRKELVERAVENIDESIELHRPYVDDVHFTCPDCGKTMTRVKDVIDCWFDSGSMPFAQYHYPFENKELWEEQFPADFICEGIDQTRGWFYSLLAISSFVTGKAPYKKVLVNDLILDAEGQKMSKTKGNSVDPLEMFAEYGADALRWYLLYVSPAWTPTRFDVKGIKEVQSKFFNTLKNTYHFFALYANTDNIDPRAFFVPYAKRPEIDAWILSKYNRLVKEVREEMEVFDLTKAVKKIQNFVNEDLSNWYIRRNRRRFWGTELTEDKKAVYNTTWEVLEGVVRLCAPFAPYITEELYQKLTDGISVHLADYPTANEELIQDAIEEPMDLVRELVSLGRGAREEAQIKVRQPLSKIIVDGKYRETLGDLCVLIEEELNIKQVVFEENLGDFMNYALKPDFKVAGPVLGKNVKLLGKALASAPASEVVAKLEADGSFVIELDGQSLELRKDFIDIRISAKEGFNVQMFNNKFIILDTSLNQDLLDEGCAREFVSRIQQLRKSSGYEVMDRIDISYSSDAQMDRAIEIFTDFIKTETLADTITIKAGVGEVFSLNGHDTRIELIKK
ncbi:MULTISPECIES: isoleucine--tRNA ligase [unclassified Acetobacterium]|uniref:isoleucine--tRNA ligase n=1 Tax=unclassified Acetobacterium TaxID=2638182 RepID=UPI000DBEB730|nr:MULTISPECIES: isoleucine--tRNA ligase [unclassified Acetobacterium]AWW27856.1 isoleucine--tRNA ligase [Acetobacterium sp. KB-1]MDZ5725773.1 isoleucine--tRNA ligase [Acetobacterium sp. K1/6]